MWVILSYSCGGSGLCNLLAAFPHRQDHIYKHPGHQDDSVLPVLQYIRHAAFLPERIHQPHPLQPHFEEAQGSSLQAAAAAPRSGKGFHGHERRWWLHGDQRQHTARVRHQPLRPQPVLLQAFSAKERIFPFTGESQKVGHLSGHVVFSNCLYAAILIFLLTEQAETMKWWEWCGMRERELNRKSWSKLAVKLWFQFITFCS